MNSETTKEREEAGKKNVKTHIYGFLGKRVLKKASPTTGGEGSNCLH